MLGVFALALAGLPSLAGAAQTFDPIVIRIPTGGGTPDALTNGDFNGDGDLDLAVGNYSSANAAVSLGLAGFGFETVSTNPVGSQRGMSRASS